MSKGVFVSVSIHRDVPTCCRANLLTFAAGDLYAGGGEPGDQIGCACGNRLVYDHRGWRLAGSAVAGGAEKEDEE